MNTDLFEGFEYVNVLKYVNKVARSLQGMLTDRALEYDDLVCHGLMAATIAFRKWDRAHDNDRSDQSHLEAYVKINISGYMKNAFIAARKRNILIDEDTLRSFDAISNEDCESEDCDNNDINGKSQRTFAKIFHVGADEESIKMMDIASSRLNVDDEDERISALEAFIASLSGIELDIMNSMLKYSKESLKDIALKYSISSGVLTRKCAEIKLAAKDFILNY